MKMRKNIDIDSPTFRALSIMAAEAGTNLKKFIEEQLVHISKKRTVKK